MTSVGASMTRWASVLLAGLAVTLLAALPTRVRADDLDAIRARGTLRVVFDANGRSDTISITPGSPPDLERELIEAFAALQRLKVEFVPVATMAERIPALLAGKGDVLAGGV